MKVSRPEWLIVLALVLLTISVTRSALIPPPISYPATAFAVTPTRIHAGETIALAITRCSSWPWDLTYEVDWTLVRADGIRVALPPSFVTTAGRGCQSGSALTLIPEGTPAGQWRVARVSQVHTWIDSYAVPSGSQVFEVVP